MLTIGFSVSPSVPSAIGDHVVEPVEHRVQLGLATRLRPAGHAAQVDDLVGRHALELFVGERAGVAQVAGVAAANPIRHRAAEAVDLHAHAHFVLGAGLRGGEVGVDAVGDALGLDQLQRQRHLAAAELDRVQADEHLAGGEHLAAQRALEVVEVHGAARVARVGGTPGRPLALDGGVHAFADLAARGGHLGLDADARADHVVDHQRAGALGIGRVAQHLPAARTQARRAAADLGVGAAAAAAAEAAAGGRALGALVQALQRAAAGRAAVGLHVDHLRGGHGRGRDHAAGAFPLAQRRVPALERAVGGDLLTATHCSSSRRNGSGSPALWPWRWRRARA
jgi:hypothetical protein